jgi:predicted nucleic acid-binding Zn ribbon protein
MDPTRPHRRRPTDIVFVGAGILVAVLLVLWAFFG